MATRIRRAAAMLGGAPPRVLLYTPVARGNPYQELLYRSLWSSGIAPVGVIDHEDIDLARTARDLGGAAAVHLHWTTGITGGAGDEDEARELGGDFLDRVRQLRGLGIPFLWTIHNALPHDCAFPRAEVAFRRGLLEECDAVLVGSGGAVAELESYYELPTERVVVVPHPSYRGAYPDFATRQDCRLRLGIDDDELVVAAVGALAPYKRIDRLHAGLRQSGRRARLLVAGDPGDGRNTDLLAALARDPWVELLPRKLTDREMSELIIASDLVSSLYESPMTSGVAALAMTLGRAVLAPDRTVSHEQLGGAGVYVDLADPGHLPAVLAALDRDDLAARGRVGRDMATRDNAAGQFAGIVDQLIPVHAAA